MGRAALGGLLLGGTLLVGCEFRATDRISEIEASQDLPVIGSIKVTYEITYSDDGTVDEVEVRNNSGDRIRRVIFTWEGDQIAEIEVDEGNDEWDAKAEYEGGRPIRLAGTKPNGEDLEIEVEYEGNDLFRPSRITTTRENGSRKDVTDTEYSYNDQGRLGHRESEITSDDSDLGLSTEFSEDHDYDYDDNLFLDKVDRTQRSGSSEAEDRARFSYNDDGTLDEAEDYDARESTLNYDDQGRIEEINGRDFNLDIEFQYEEGSTRGFSYAPYGLVEGDLYDVRGLSHGLMDVRQLFVSVLVVE
jgi:hypothetical protein